MSNEELKQLYQKPFLVLQKHCHGESAEITMDRPDGWKWTLKVTKPKNKKQQ